MSDDEPATDGSGVTTAGVELGLETEARTGTGSVSALRAAAVDTGLVAVREYRLAVRRRWALGVAVLFALFSVALVFLGGSAVGPTRVAAVLASFAQLGVYVVPLAALAVGFDTIVGADESGSLEMLLALPLSNAAVVVGTYLGRRPRSAAGCSSASPSVARSSSGSLASAWSARTRASSSRQSPLRSRSSE